MLVKNELSLLYWKNWKFWYKLVAGLFTIGIFLAVFISGIIDVKNLGNEVLDWFNGYNKNQTLDQFRDAFEKKFASRFRVDWISIIPVLSSSENRVIDLSISAGYGEYAFFFNTFFTNISNLLVGVWFLSAALMPKKEGKNYYLGFSSTMIVTTYISLTMIIFTFVLAPAALTSGIGNIKLTWEVIVVGILQHIIFPIALIVYVCLFYNTRYTMTNEKYMKKEWWKLIFWLLVYLAWSLIRGEIRYRGRRPLGTQYPYFFMQIHDPKVMGMPGVAWLVIVVIIIFGLIFGTSILLNFIITRRVHRQKRKKVW